MCIECHLNSYLPTKTDDQPWIFVKRTKRESLIKTPIDLKLQLAVTFLPSEISQDKNSVVLKVDGKSFSIPVTVETLDDLAERSGVLTGKWLIYRNAAEVDRVWRTIAQATFKGVLGRSAKVSTAASRREQHVICVYTDNYLNLEDVMRVRAKLRVLGFSEQLCYKPDLYTCLGIYDGTTNLLPCRYRK